MRIQRVEIEGYRALEHVALELESLAVLIGPNGSGKSTFLDVFALLSGAMTEGLPKGFIARGGFARTLTLGKTQRLRIALDTDDVAWPEGGGASPIRYEIDLHATGNSYAVVEEHLTQQRDAAKPFRYIERRAEAPAIYFDPSANALVQPGWNPKPGELALAQLPRGFSAATDFRSVIASARAYSSIDLDPRSSLRNAQTLQPDVSFPSPTGDDLLSALYRMDSAEETSYQQLLDNLSAAFPGFQKLKLPVVAGGQVTLAWYVEGLSGPLYGHELSSGTLRFLHLAAMLLSPELPPLLVLDEPEVSFHPELIRLLADLLVDAASRTQLIVATHSASLLRWLKPEQVVTVDRSETGSILQRADSQDLAHWLEKYTLDELWLMNVLGAQP